MPHANQPPTPTASQASEQDAADLVVGGYGPLSRSAVTALQYAADVIGKDHHCRSGQTALFWHLISTAAQHISTSAAAITKAEGGQP